MTGRRIGKESAKKRVWPHREKSPQNWKNGLNIGFRAILPMFCPPEKRFFGNSFPISGRRPGLLPGTQMEGNFLGKPCVSVCFKRWRESYMSQGKTHSSELKFSRPNLPQIFLNSTPGSIAGPLESKYFDADFHDYFTWISMTLRVLEKFCTTHVTSSLLRSASISSISGSSIFIGGRSFLNPVSIGAQRLFSS